MNNNIDVISLSAASVNLSDTSFLYNIAEKVSRNTVIVAAADNDGYVAVPSSFPFVVAAQHDWKMLNNIGEIHYTYDDHFGINATVNCAFDFLPCCGYLPSNSIAVPYVASKITSLKSIEYEYYTNCFIAPREGKSSSYKNTKTTLLFCGLNIGERVHEVINEFYSIFGIQTVLLTTIKMPYDIRVIPLTDLKISNVCISSLIHRYKFDVLLIAVANKDELPNKCLSCLDVDVYAEICDDAHSLISWESGAVKVSNKKLLDTIIELISQ